MSGRHVGARKPDRIYGVIHPRQEARDPVRAPKTITKARINAFKRGDKARNSCAAARKSVQGRKERGALLCRMSVHGPKSPLTRATFRLVLSETLKRVELGRRRSVGAWLTG